MACRKGKQPVVNQLAERFCPHCKAVKTIEDFYSNRAQPNGTSVWCKECSKTTIMERQASMRKRSMPVSQSGIKTCLVCQQVLPLAAFYDSCLSKDGKRAHCRGCWCVHLATLHVSPQFLKDLEYQPPLQNPPPHPHIPPVWKRISTSKDRGKAAFSPASACSPANSNVFAMCSPRSKAQKMHTARMPLEPQQITTKACSRCLATKPASSFHKYARSRDGKQGWCSQCMNRYSRERWAMQAGTPSPL